MTAFHAAITPKIKTEFTVTFSLSTSEFPFEQSQSSYVSSTDPKYIDIPADANAFYFAQSTTTTNDNGFEIINEMGDVQGAYVIADALHSVKEMKDMTDYFSKSPWHYHNVTLIDRNKNILSQLELEKNASKNPSSGHAGP